MKMIQAIIRPERFEEVKDALEEKGHFPMNSVDVSGRGVQKGITLEYRGKQVRVDTLPKLMIELVANDGDLDEIIASICGRACTGRKGDGKIFVLPVDRAIRIRTGEEWK